ncbi:MAG: xanthine dehydrogenase family protein subunit M [Acidobacteria bacterium]|nr:xanthine dehydrogenase family protein subunit M [Acidobacteriota bacterium]
MQDTQMIRPETIEEACAFLLQHPEARVIAGGASVTFLWKNNLISPTEIVSLKKISSLRHIEMDAAGRLLIGALCSHYQVETSPVIGEVCPVLAEAASSIASPPIRNMATIGGNICQSDPSADLPPALIALNAILEITGPGGLRTVPVADFFSDYFTNILQGNEILTKIIIPPLPPHGGAYKKLARSVTSRAVVGVAAVLASDGKGLCTYSGLAISGVGPTPLVIPEVKAWLGKKIELRMIEEAAGLAVDRSEPISDANGSAEYRKEMIGVVMKRAVTQAWERALQGVPKG